MVKKGFSIVELLVVLAVLGILIGISSVMLPKNGPESKRAAYQIANLSTLARFEAIKRNKPVRVALVSGAIGAYIDADSNGAFSSGDTEIRPDSWVRPSEFKTTITFTVATPTIWKAEGIPSLTTMAAGSTVTGSYKADAGGKIRYVCVTTVGKSVQQDSAC